jgi:hypothetical protein
MPAASQTVTHRRKPKIFYLAKTQTRKEYITERSASAALREIFYFLAKTQRIQIQRSAFATLREIASLAKPQRRKE